MNLYEIETEYLKIIKELEQYFLDNPDDEGLIPEEFNERLNINKNEMEDKILNYYRFIKDLEAKNDALAFEINRLNKIKISRNRLIAHLKKNIETAVCLYGEINLKSKAAIPSKTYQSDFIKATFVYKPSIEINEEVLPEDYFVHNLEVIALNKDIATKLETKLLELGYSVKDKKQPDKDRIKEEIQEQPIPGVVLDKNAGYIKFS